MVSRIGRTLIAVAFAAALGAALAAQQAPGRVTGTILDPNNNVITGFTGALMTMTNASGELRTDVTLQGTFNLANVPPGSYDLRVQLGGAMYQSYTQQNVVVASGQTLDLKIPIKWGINLGTFGDDPTVLAKDMARSGESLNGPAPRTRAGKPDLTGVWVTAGANAAGQNPPIPMQPWAQEMNRKLTEVRGPDSQNPGAYCLPQSAVLSMVGFPYKFIQADDVIVQLVEFATPGIRQIFMDGRPHPKPEDWNPSWHGHSIGRWEGDTLVIDNVGFNDITPGFGIHSEKLHVVERIRRTSFNRLEIEITADDSEAFTGPWKTIRYGALSPDHEILEFVCPENNKDMQNFGGLGWKGRP
jgi:hypothetical protein